MNRPLIIVALTFVMPFGFLFDEETYLLLIPLFGILWSSGLGFQIQFDVPSVIIYLQAVSLFMVPYVILCLVSAWQINLVHSKQLSRKSGDRLVIVGIVVLVAYFLLFTIWSFQLHYIYHGPIGPVPLPITPLIALLFMVE